jgi:hypothetical protein
MILSGLQVAAARLVHSSGSALARAQRGPGVSAQSFTWMSFAGAGHAWRLRTTPTKGVKSRTAGAGAIL